jgi:predicted alpha/beta hydrolase family esterase
MQKPKIVIVPDYGGVSKDHWLEHWRSNHPDSMRFAEHQPLEPTCKAWLRGIDDAVAACGPRTSIVAQGLGCLAVAHWATLTQRRIESAMLVSVPDIAACGQIPVHLPGFVPVPRRALPFRTLMVAAASDGDYQHALAHANDWDATFVLVGSISHDTRPGARHTWDEGLDLLWNLVEADPVS